jgi:hypothetical protein
MGRTARRRLMAAAVLIGILATRLVDAAVVYDNGTFNGAAASNISRSAIADDFTLTSAATLDSLQFWAVSINNPSGFGGFDGTIGFAFHSDNAGIPGAILSQGFDNSITPVNTGSQVTNLNIFQLDVDLGGVMLDPGTYWLQLREGLIGSAYDGDSIFWVQTAGVTGNTNQSDANEQNPTWGTTDGVDLAFNLSGTLTPSTTPAVPEPSTGLMLLLAMAGGSLRKCFRRTTPASSGPATDA